ncbi:MAG: FKBP-type peptidyl-prolyl cis-trans isomerase FklB [Luteibaculaceae bacterium]|jgi:FKBP-type peptidyl-prolyl cis-trans isomerase FklB
MQIKNWMFAGVIALASCANQGKMTETLEKLETEEQKVAYAIGMDIARNLASSGIKTLDASALAQGLNQTMVGGDVLLGEAEAQEVIQGYFAKIQEEKFSGNIEEGKTFLIENKTKDGVVELPSGLQYEILTEGKGEKPGINDVVKTHYHGTLLDGKVFDSSVDRGEPISFPVSGVIAGWTEALQLMAVGSKWKLYVPSELAYGERGAGADIGPHSTLIFEVELLEIEAQK